MSESQTPVATPPGPESAAQPKKGNPFGITALVLGIISLATAAIPFFNYASLVMGAVGLILGIVGLVVKFRSRKAAVAGVILSALGLILSIILVTIYAAIFFGVSKAVDDSNAAAAASHKLVYSVSGDSTDATVTYSTYSDGKSGSEQATDAKLPFTKAITVKGSSDGFSFNSFTLSGTNGSTGGKITCKITLDGKVVSTQTSSGAYASASCDGSN